MEGPRASFQPQPHPSAAHLARPALLAPLLKAPVKLVPETGNPSTVTAPYKLIEDQHVVIIRNNEKYDVTGKKL